MTQIRPDRLQETWRSAAGPLPWLLAGLLGLVLTLNTAGVLADGPISPFQFAEGLPARIVHVSHPARPAGGLARGVPGYDLYILTASYGVDFSTGQVHVLPPDEARRQSRIIVGHSWLILESPRRRTERGHRDANSGPGGGERWLDGVLRLVRKGDPNPIAYLWRNFTSGARHGRPDDVHATFVLRLPLTPVQHAAIDRLLANYDYRTYNLVEHECTNLVASATRLAGVEVEHQVEITIPPLVKLMGSGPALRVWTDPRYATLIIACPDVLEACLRRLAIEGVGEDVTTDY